MYIKNRTKALEFTSSDNLALGACFKAMRFDLTFLYSEYKINALGEKDKFYTFSAVIHLYNF